MDWLGNQISRFIRIQFAGMAIWGVWFVCVGSWSFGVGIVLCLSCWIPEFLRKVRKVFEIFSQPSELVGKPNQPVHWVRLSGTAV